MIKTLAYTFLQTLITFHLQSNYVIKQYVVVSFIILKKSVIFPDLPWHWLKI